MCTSAYRTVFKHVYKTALRSELSELLLLSNAVRPRHSRAGSPYFGGKASACVHDLLKQLLPTARSN